MRNDSITIYMNEILQDAYLAHIFRCVKKPSTSISCMLLTTLSSANEQLQIITFRLQRT